MDKKDYKWIISILITIIGLLLFSIIMIVSYKLSNDRDMVNIISIGSGLVSIVLGLVAIFYAAIQSYQTSGQNTQLNNTMIQIDKRVNDLGTIVNQIQIVKENIEKFSTNSETNFSDMFEQLNGLEEKLNLFIDVVNRDGNIASKEYVQEFKNYVNDTFIILKEKLISALNNLTPLEEKVLRLRFGLDDGKARTLEEVSEIMHINKEEAHKIETVALRKLRNMKIF